MDLKKSKPVHLNCPKCGYDFSVNTNRIEEDYANARIKTASLEKEITRMKNSGISRKSPAFKRVLVQHKDAQAQCAAIKKARKALSDESELQKFQIFKGLVKGVIGDEKTIELLQKAEDELVFNDYDTAIQKFNRFGGV